MTPLYEDEDILAFDKPYGLNTHTNDSKMGQTDFIQDGLIEILEKQRKQKLYIIHRLDQTTSGVIIFGKSPESSKKYAEFFFNREVQKTYWFVTASKSAQPTFSIDQIIVHKGKELEAQTEFKFLQKSNSFELWQAHPLTGRNHQIRIHASAAGIPILGDPKYGGVPFPFLCLHNCRIEFPNKIIIQSRAPLYFEKLEYLQDLTLAKALFESERRFRLYSFSPPQDPCFRLAQVRDTSHELEFAIDVFGQTLVMNWHKEFWGESDARRFATFAGILKKPLIIRRPKTQVLQIPIAEVAVETEWTARENGILYEIRSGAGLSAGLFLNLRLQRNWVLSNSKGKSVLSLFSTNGGFALSAALGKAQQVTLVESNKSLLNWGRRNFELNSLDPEKYKFLCRDSLVFLKQNLSKGLQFDLVICEAPSFYRGEKKNFKIEVDLEMLLSSCLHSLAPQGQLLFSTSAESIFVDDIRKTILKVQKDSSIGDLEIESIQPSLDFDLPDEKTSLKSFLISRLS